MRRRGTPLLWLLGLAMAGCGGWPVVTPAPAEAVAETLAACRAVFPARPWTAVHTLHATLPYGRRAAFLGATAAGAPGKGFQTVLMTAEGQTLLEVSWNEADGSVTVQRALPPLDKPGFVAGLVADVRRVFFAPEGAPEVLGALSDGRTVCRWTRPEGGRVDVVGASPMGWEIRAYDAEGTLRREVRAERLARPGFAARIVIDAEPEPGYRYTITLEPVQLEGPESRR